MALFPRAKSESSDREEYEGNPFKQFLTKVENTNRVSNII